MLSKVGGDQRQMLKAVVSRVASACELGGHETCCTNRKRPQSATWSGASGSLCRFQCRSGKSASPARSWPWLLAKCYALCAFGGSSTKPAFQIQRVHFGTDLASLFVTGSSRSSGIERRGSSSQVWFKCSFSGSRGSSNANSSVRRSSRKVINSDREIMEFRRSLSDQIIQLATPQAVGIASKIGGASVRELLGQEDVTSPTTSLR